MKKIAIKTFTGLYMLCVLRNSCFAQYTKLVDFVGVTNGSGPRGALLSDGTFLYGTTNYGGANDLGVVFKIKPDGTGYAKLFDFVGINNGSKPFGALISEGNFLYGMTSEGGANDSGTVFKIKPDGTGYANILDFSGAANGKKPLGSSLFSDGVFLYGMTYSGGTNSSGVIFKIKPDGTGYSKLLDFSGAANGKNPYGSLISDGTFLYGMTYAGGTNNKGVIFKIMPNGTGYSKILDFAGANGQNPFGDLISDGTFLYGITYAGGTNNVGVLFKIMPDGTGYSKLLDFAGVANGTNPHGSLVFDGTFLYGMVPYGGLNGMGVLFKIRPNGTGFSKLLDFSGFANGRTPLGSLISDGTFLYGTTKNGGTNDLGTVFKYQYCTSLVFTQSPSICTGQSVVVGNHIYTSGGTYHDTLTSNQGCDSIVSTILTVNAINTSVLVSGLILTASASSASYQWINCNNGHLPIVGQTNQSFTATANGSYAVIVTQNSCSDTSSCSNITTTGITENSFATTINIYPNPFTSQTNIKFLKEQKNITVKIFEVFGKEINSINFTGNQLTVEKGSMSEGIYILQVYDENKNLINKKLIVQ